MLVPPPVKVKSKPPSVPASTPPLVPPPLVPPPLVPPPLVPPPLVPLVPLGPASAVVGSVVLELQAAKRATKATVSVMGERAAAFMFSLRVLPRGSPQGGQRFWRMPGASRPVAATYSS